MFAQCSQSSASPLLALSLTIMTPRQTSSKPFGQPGPFDQSAPTQNHVCFVILFRSPKSDFLSIMLNGLLKVES